MTIGAFTEYYYSGGPRHGSEVREHTRTVRLNSLHVASYVDDSWNNMERVVVKMANGDKFKLIGVTCEELDAWMKS